MLLALITYSKGAPFYNAISTVTIRIMNKHGISLIVLVVWCVPLTLVGQQNRHQLSTAEEEHILDGQFTMVSTTDGDSANRIQLRHFGPQQVLGCGGQLR